MTWKIEYHNDTGPQDDYFVEWWEVTDNEKRFRTVSELDAEWLLDLLNRKMVIGKKSK